MHIHAPALIEEIYVDPETYVVQLPGRPGVALAGRGPLWRLVQAILKQHQDAPGVPLTTMQMFQAGWPNERALPRAAANRVYSGIHTLRLMGLGRVILHRRGGYLLASHVTVVQTRLMAESLVA